MELRPPNRDKINRDKTNRDKANHDKSKSKLKKINRDKSVIASAFPRQRRRRIGRFFTLPNQRFKHFMLACLTTC